MGRSSKTHRVHGKEQQDTQGTWEGAARHTGYMGRSSKTHRVHGKEQQDTQGTWEGAARHTGYMGRGSKTHRVHGKEQQDTQQGCIQDSGLGGKLSFLKCWGGGGGNTIRDGIGVQRLGGGGGGGIIGNNTMWGGGGIIQ